MINPVHKLFGAATAVLLSAGLTAGCMDRNQDNIPDEAQPSVPGSAADRAHEALDKTQQVAENAAITGRVKSELLADKTVGAAKINVDTVDGVVTLKGEVRTEEEKTRAGEIATKVPGVSTVVNELVVSPSQAEQPKSPPP